MPKEKKAPKPMARNDPRRKFTNDCRWRSGFKKEWRNLAWVPPTGEWSRNA